MTLWSVAITTAPRKEPTLQRCVDSVRAAGWEPIVFAEPGSEEVDCQTIHNKHKFGVYRNWLQAADWTLKQAADAILLLQDDVEIHPESKEWVENLLWPSNCGYISLYTPKHYQETYGGDPKPNGFYEVETAAMWGACALVFPPEILGRLIDHPRTVNWAGAPTKFDWFKIRNWRLSNPSEIKNNDILIGSVLRKFFRKRLMYFNPSLANHISTYSSCGHGTNTNKRNAKVVADFNRPLADQIPLKKEH